MLGTMVRMKGLLSLMSEEHKYTKEGVALLNQDDTNYTRYVQHRNRLRAARSESSELKNKVEKLESDISDIKSLLEILVGKK